MATQAAPLEPLAPSVHYEWSKVGTDFIDKEKGNGRMLPTQESFTLGRESGIQVAIITTPGGHLLSKQSTRPSSLKFGALNDLRYRLRKPIPLEVSVEESNVVVTWAAIDEFGNGETLSAAISDFARSLRELHRNLCENQDIGPGLVNVKRILAEYIEARPR